MHVLCEEGPHHWLFGEGLVPTLCSFAVVVTLGSTWRYRLHSRSPQPCPERAPSLVTVVSLKSTMRW